MEFLKNLLQFRFRLIAGALIWLLWSIANFKFPLHPHWGRMLLLLAPLVIVPMMINFISSRPFLPQAHLLKKIEKWTLPAAICLAVAYQFDQGMEAALLSLPWLFITLVVAWFGVKGIINGISTSSANSTQVAIYAGMAYLSVGGLWAIADRMGWRPLGYDPEIVFLTVAHFHYAGFVLPIVAGLVFGELKNSWAKTAVYGILLGVLLVAVGIVVSQLGGGPLLETIAAWWLALSAMLLAFLHIKIPLRRGLPAEVAVCFSIAGVALIGGMLLAGLYGMRHIFPIAGLDIPMMRALHGAANVFGFGVFAAVGWWLYLRKNQ